MTGRRIKLHKNTKIKDGQIINPEPRAKDAAQAMRWRKSKKSMPVTKARAQLNTIGKVK